MRFAYLALLSCACKKAEPPAPTPPAPIVSDAAVADAAPDAPSAAKIVDVELVQLTAANVRVSSKVANPNIKPTHLVDKNMSTAWNSVTGQLAGAWIEVRPIAGAEIHDVRLTAGFTAKGPKGEDWFTMNPRIKRMRVLADGNPQPDIYLDVDKRTLQAFPIVASESVRLEVVDVVAGSKKQWREISVSELEAWGTTPSGWTSPKPLPSIEVAVGEPETPAGFDPCKGIDERREEVEAQYRNSACNEPGCEDHNYPPLCDLAEAKVDGDPLEPPWDTYTVWCESNDQIYGPSTCNVRFARGTDEATVTSDSQHGRPSMHIDLEMKEVLADSAGREMVVTISDDKTLTAICRADRYKCSAMLEVPEGADLAKQAWVFK